MVAGTGPCLSRTRSSSACSFCFSQPSGRARRWICSIASRLVTAQSASGSQRLTARHYFNELRDANAFNHYGDEYVCFPDEDRGNFTVIAKTKGRRRWLEEPGPRCTVG
jgi:hypothetical protein